MMMHLRFPAYLIACLLFVACKKNKTVEIAELRFPGDTYYVSTNSDLRIYINQGNKKYQLTVDDASLIQAQADGEPSPAGWIMVKGLKKGSTLLKVKDQVNGKEVALTIHVVDPFLTFKLGQAVAVLKVAPRMTQAVRNTISQKAQTFADFDPETLLVLQRTPQARFYIFEKGKELSPSKIIDSGTYELAFDEAGKQQLSLNFDNRSTELHLGVLANSTWAKTTLKNFAANGKSQTSVTSTPARSTVPNEFFDRYISTFKDITMHFDADADIESITLAQSMEIWPDFQDYGVRIAPGVLTD
jgi:hypothetical protein